MQKANEILAESAIKLENQIRFAIE